MISEIEQDEAVQGDPDMVRGDEEKGVPGMNVISSFLFVAVTIFILFFCSAGTAVPAGDGANSCIRCHSHPDFRVIDKKLYKYYRDWKLSIHAQEGVTCTDCHGGNPDMAEKEQAHGNNIKRLLDNVEYERILTTCGRCHEENAGNFKKSKHFRILSERGRSRPTPTCVTCHGSINTSIPKPDTVAGICAHCHNAVTENHPEIPERATYLVERLSFLNSQFRYLVSKGVLEKSPDFSSAMERELSDLARIWHTLELDRIEEKTLQIRTLMMNKRKELKREIGQAE